MKQTALMGLTLFNPWAYSIAHLDNRVENRTWAPPAELIGKRLAIHAGKGIDPTEWASAGKIAPQLRQLPMTNIPYGAIVAVVTVAGFVRVADGQIVARGGVAARTYDPTADRWFRGPCGWLLSNVTVLPEPIQLRGGQRLWYVPTDIARGLLAMGQESKVTA